MNVLPKEIHPSRAISKEISFLGKLFLDATAELFDFSEVICCKECEPEEYDKWVGVTHYHCVEGENFVLQIKTFYDAIKDTYYLLEVVKIGYIEELDNDDTITPDPEYIISRWKKNPEKDEEIDLLSKVINLFKPETD